MIREFLSFIAFIILKAWISLLRIQVHERQHSIGLIERQQPVIYAFFHGKQLALLGYPAPKPMAQMVSLSADGEWQTRILRLFGFQIVRGSQGKRGREALWEMTELVLNGCNAALAVDGSRGPREKVKPGILHLASDSGAPIIPVGVASSNVTKLTSAWDHYEIPWPLSTVVIIEGEALHIPEDILDDDLSLFRCELEKRMIDLQNEAQSRLVTVTSDEKKKP